MMNKRNRTDLQVIIETILIIVMIFLSCIVGNYLVSQSVEVANAIKLIGDAFRGLR